VPELGRCSDEIDTGSRCRHGARRSAVERGSKLSSPGAPFLPVEHAGRWAGAHAPDRLAKTVERKGFTQQGKSPVGGEALREAGHRQYPEFGPKHREHFGELPAVAGIVRSVMIRSSRPECPSISRRADSASAASNTTCPSCSSARRTTRRTDASLSTTRVVSAGGRPTGGRRLGVAGWPIGSRDRKIRTLATPIFGTPECGASIRVRRGGAGTSRGQCVPR